VIGFESTPEGETAVPRLLGELLGDLRVQDCLWVGLMEWDLRIENVALRPRFGAEGGTRPDGWVLCVGMGPGVRLEVTAGCQGDGVGHGRTGRFMITAAGRSMV